MGVNYVSLEGDIGVTLRDALATDGVTLIDVMTSDSTELRLTRTKELAKGQAKRLLGPEIVARLKELLGR